MDSANSSFSGGFKGNRAQDMYCKKRNRARNIVFNKVAIDSGYPQDIFSKLTPHKNRDYLTDNKKNLRNFFVDRVPTDVVRKETFKDRSHSIDAVHMFEVKRQQFELKSKTQFTLDDSLMQGKQQSEGQQKKIEKIRELFQVHDKGAEVKRCFGSNLSYRKDRHWGEEAKDNHRMGTSSSIQKKSNLMRRQAYEKVFGRDISMISRTLPVTPVISSQASQTKGKSLTQRNSSFQECSAKKRSELSSLIHKIDEYKRKIKPVRLDFEEEQEVGEQDFENLQDSGIVEVGLTEREVSAGQQRENIVRLIRNITAKYQTETVAGNREPISELSDLRKVDREFYDQMSRHKQSRLNKRMNELYKYSLPSSHQMVSRISHVPSDSLRQSKVSKDLSQDSECLSLDQERYVPDSERSELRPLAKDNVARFKFLAKNLIKAVLLSSLYLVPRLYVFPAFWQKREPYELEGTYAFFKAIKKNDKACVESFLTLNFEYLYEINDSGRTPLIYACLHDNADMASLFLEKGSNVDKVCYKGKTALHYALENQNLQTLTLLLQYGAEPWSSKENPYRSILKQNDDQRVHILFRNSKKINIAMRMQLGTHKRAEFWHQNKWKIQSEVEY